MISQELEALAVTLHGSFANKYAKQYAIRNILTFLEKVNPTEYRRLHRGLYDFDYSAKEYETMLPLSERVERLAVRLEDAGQPTDADTCRLAILASLKEDAA